METRGQPRYELGPTLGEGGMGRVYRATDRLLGRTVALKVVRPDLLERPGAQERFEVEVRLAARISHPNVLPVLDVGTLDGARFLVMPLAEGSLARAGWDALLPRLLAVLDALAAVHARGVVHRDLKPDNVLVSGGDTWLADLGLAQVRDEIGRPAQASRGGTPGYMAPEQREGGQIGPAADLYAFGALVDELGSGVPVPRGLHEVLDVLQHPDPEGRFALAADVRRALEALGPPAVVLRGRAGRAARTLDAFDEGDEVDELPSASVADLRRRPSLPADEVPAEPWVPVRATPSLYVLREVPTVGRDAERAALWAAARAVASDGRPRAVLVEGEPGAGRTHVVRSVARALEEAGHAEVVRLTDEMAGDELRRRIATLAWRGLVVVWVDDAHRPSREDALRLALGLLEQDAPVLVVCGADPAVASPELDDLRAVAARIVLGRLGRADLHALLAATLALEPTAEELLLDRCAGSPRVLRELLVHLAGQGALEDLGELSHALRDPEEALRAVPADTRALLEERVRRVVEGAPDPAASRLALARLALAGERVPADVAPRLAGATVGALLAAGLLAREGGAVVFDPPMLRELLLEGADPSPRRWSEVADALLERGDDAAVGRALHAAGRHVEALPRLLRAAERRAGHATARAELARMAVGSADAVGTAEDRAKARQWLATIQHLDLDPETATRTAQEGAALPASDGTRSVLGSLVGYVQMMQGRLDDAEATLADALALARSSGDGAVIGRALRVLGLLRKRQRRFVEAVAALEEALRLLGTGPDGNLALTSLAEVRLSEGNRDEALRLSREAVDRSAVGTEGEVTACGKLASTLLVAGRAAEAAPWIERAIATATRIGLVLQLPSLRGIQAQVALVEGRHEDARAALVAYLGWAERRRKWDTVVGVRLNLAQIAMETDDAPALGEHCAALDALALPPGHLHAATARLFRVVERADRGDLEGARALLVALAREERDRVADDLRAAVRERFARRGLHDLADALW